MSNFQPPSRFTAFMTKVYGAALLLLGIALGARLVWALIEPFLWMVLTVLVLGAIYALIFRGFQR